VIIGTYRRFIVGSLRANPYRSRRSVDTTTYTACVVPRRCPACTRAQARPDLDRRRTTAEADLGHTGGRSSHPREHPL